jgi:hypothetical protein
LPFTGKGSLREGRFADCDGAALGNSLIPVHLKHGGTQLQTSRPNLLVDIAKKTPFNFLCGSGWFARIEKRELEKNSLVPICTKSISTAVSSATIMGGSSQATMHIYEVKRLVCRFAHGIGQLRS